MEQASALTEHFAEGMTAKKSNDIIAAKNQQDHIPYLDLVLK